MEFQNPFRNPHARPDWAQFTRLAGDRAAILFEELRAAIGDVEGLREDIHFVSEEVGWAPRYRLGEVTLFIVRVLPGSLEAVMELEQSEREAFLAARGVSDEIRDTLQRATVRDAVTSVHVRLADRAQVSSWAKAMRARSRLVTRQTTK